MNRTMFVPNGWNVLVNDIYVVRGKPATVGSYQPAGAHKLEQTSPTKRELVLRGWGIIKLRVRVANTTFVVKRAVSVAAAVMHARAGGGS